MIFNRIEIDYKKEAVYYSNWKYGGGTNLKGRKKSKYVLFSKEFFTKKVMIAFYQYSLENFKKGETERNDIQGTLSDLGYERFVLIDDCYTTSRRSINDFSTMRDGGTCNFWIKGELIVVYGLHEHNKPPTLISPLPFNGLFNADRMIKKYGAKKIIDAIENEYLLDV